MLIINRKIGERLFIGDEILIELLAHHEGQIRLGIHAPRSIEVFREELYQRIFQRPHPMQLALLASQNKNQLN